jgi:predicted patatin/cPLA2 family phospholipase
VDILTGVVDVGGGLRGIYGAGVFDWCLQNDVRFDFNIGVSAGSANVMSYMAGQQGRNYIFYTQYSFRRDYMSFHEFIRTGNYVNLEYVFGEALSNSGGEYPLDYDTAAAEVASGRIVKIVSTDAVTGRPTYFDFSDMSRDDYGAVKASSCVPLVCKPYEWKGRLYYDGGISDPIPYKKAFECGCDKVVIILTKPKHGIRESKNEERAARYIRRKFPQTAHELKHRAELYNRELRGALELEKQGKVLIIAPEDIGGMRTLNRDFSDMDKMYSEGYSDAKAIMDFI